MAETAHSMNAAGTPASAKIASAEQIERFAWVFAVAVLAVVVLTYVACVWQLVSYPYDWTFDEGLYLDFARRLIESPRSLYNDRGVPVPDGYGPLFPAFLTPFIRLSRPLAAARIFTLVCALLGVVAVWVLMRRRAGALWATGGAALYLAGFNVTSWYMLVRIDALMVTLWLWAAVALLPREPARAGSSAASPNALSRGRLAAGTVLILAASLVKPTAVVHSFPLVLGWFFVNRKSAWRLSIAVTGAGLLTLLALEIATRGGFLKNMLLWRMHVQEPGLFMHILVDFGQRTWPLLLLALAALSAAIAGRARPLREPAMLMVVGGLLILPVTGKTGACWNYLLPLYAAVAIVAVHWAARALPAGNRLMSVAGSGLAALALGLATTQPLPLPTIFDEDTARTLYGFTQAFQGKVGGPFLVSGPDLIYFLAKQDAEIEGSAFPFLASNHLPAAEEVLARLRVGRYTLVAIMYPLPAGPEWQRALVANYRPAGVCRLASYFMGLDVRLFIRRNLPYAFAPPTGVRCQAVRSGG